MEDAKEVVCVDFKTNIFFNTFSWADIIYPHLTGMLLAMTTTWMVLYITTVVIANYWVHLKLEFVLVKCVCFVMNSNTMKLIHVLP